MARTYIVATYAAVAVALAAWSLRTRSRSSGRQRELSDDCLVDECGADGMPLNAYAG